MIDNIAILLVLIPALPLAATLVTAVLGKRVLRGQSHWPTVAAIAASCAASVLLVFAVQGEVRKGTGRVVAAGDSDTSSHLSENAPRPQVGYEKTVSLWAWATVSDAYQGVQGSGFRGQDSIAAGSQVLNPEFRTLNPSLEPRTLNPSSRDFHIDVVLRADPLTAVMLAVVTFVSLLVAIYSIGYMRGDPGYWRFFTYIALFVFSMTMLVSASNFVLLYVFWEAVGLCSYLLIGFWFEKPAAAASGF
jgi:NADH-quinone oxidoreductase subunit L